MLGQTVPLFSVKLKTLFPHFKVNICAVLYFLNTSKSISQFFCVFGLYICLKNLSLLLYDVFSIFLSVFKVKVSAPEKQSTGLTTVLYCLNFAYFKRDFVIQYVFCINLKAVAVFQNQITFATFYRLDLCVSNDLFRLHYYLVTRYKVLKI